MQKRVLPVLFITLLLDMIGIGMLIPIIPIIFTDPTSPEFLLPGTTVQMCFILAGLITALYGLVQFIAAPILGELSDVFGRKRLLTLGVGVLAISNVLFGFGIMIKSLALLFFARGVAGLAAANFSIAQASIADVSKPEERAKNFGLVGAAFGIGFIVGPVLGGWVAGFAHSAAAPFWLSGALGILNLISLSLFYKETHTDRKAESKFHIFKGIQNIKSAIADKDAFPIYMTSFLYMSGFAFFTSFIGIYLVNRFGFNETSIGTFFGVVGAWVVISQVFVLGFLTKLFKERQILKVSLLVFACSLAVYPFIPSAILLFVLVPLIAIPQGVTMANLTSLVSKSVPPARQGAALGINSSLLALAQGIIPVLAGAGSAIIGLHAPFIVGGALVLCAWSVLFLRKVR